MATALRDQRNQRLAAQGEAADVATDQGRAVLAIACVATFLAYLDVTVVNVAFPDLQRDFPGVGISALSWVVSGYAVAFAALLAPAGRFADVVGRRRVFLGGVAVFTLGSALSAFAPSIAVLIGARTLQGLAAAAMIPSALGLVLMSTAPGKRSVAIGLWGAAGSIATAVGPTLGGILVDAFNWRAVFVINLPIGLAALVRGRRLPRTPRSDKALPDGPGTFGLAAALGALVVGLTKAEDWGWTSPATLVSVVAGLLLLALVLRRSRRHPAPAVETDLWRSRPFAAANLSSLFIGAAVFAWLLASVLYVVTLWHYPILETGLAVSPGAFTAMAASVVAGRIAERRGERLPVIFGALLLCATGLWFAAIIPPHPAYVRSVLPAGLVGGFAMGAAMIGLASAAAKSVAPAQFAAATGLNMTARQLGGALGIAVLAVLLEAHRGPHALEGFRDVYIFCGLAAAAAAVCALRLRGIRATEQATSNDEGARG